MAQIDNYDLYLRHLADINSQQGGHVKPYGNFIKWLYEISMELYKEYFEQFDKSQRIEDAISVPFLKSININVVAQPGRPYDIVAFPSDYGHFASARVLISDDGGGDGDGKGCACVGLDTYDGRTGKKIEEVEAGANSKYRDPDEEELKESEFADGLYEADIKKIDNTRWGSVMGHPFLMPSISKPVITQFSGGFKVAPKGIGTIVMDYFKTPVVPVFSYTLDINNNIVYDQGGSIQVEWPATLINEIVKRLGKRFGKYVREEFIYEASENERKITR